MVTQSLRKTGLCVPSQQAVSIPVSIQASRATGPSESQTHERRQHRPPCRPTVPSVISRPRHWNSPLGPPMLGIKKRGKRPENETWSPQRAQARQDKRAGALGGVWAQRAVTRQTFLPFINPSRIAVGSGVKVPPFIAPKPAPPQSNYYAINPPEASPQVP
jgi:hypothetical protein